MKKMNMIQAVSAALMQEMERNPNMFLIGEEISKGTFGITRGFADKFGKHRVVDTPISEKAIVGAAVGAACIGLTPIAELMFSDFLTCCYDEIVNQAAKLHYMFGEQATLNMVLRLPTGLSRQASAQHSQSLEAVLTHIPGLKVVFPSNAADTMGLLVASIRDNNPIMFLEHKKLYREQFEVEDFDEIQPIELGKAKVVREGKDVTVLATGWYVMRTMTVAEELAKEGVDVEVIDPRTLVPFDKETLFRSVEKTGKLVVVSEECKRGAWTAEAAAVVAEQKFEALKKPILRVNALDTPIPFSPGLESYVVPREADIKKAILRLV